MTEYTSIRIPVEARETAKQSKRDDETWAAFIQRCAETDPDHVTVGLSDEIETRLQNLEKHTLTTNNRLGKIERTLDALQIERM
jgi:predicted DNA-binding protein